MCNGIKFTHKYSCNDLVMALAIFAKILQYLFLYSSVSNNKPGVSSTDNGSTGSRQSQKQTKALALASAPFLS
jgi:hypothetical protein